MAQFICSQWAKLDSADPEEEHSQQHVPARDRQPLPQPAGAGHRGGRGRHRLRDGLSPLRRPRADLPQVLEQGEDRGPAEAKHARISPSAFRQADS